ncbi:class IV adenylate cyclase [Candidatus Woesearchaeota archaeon]|nr:class IV adenylate cyclase [Candidatus Woesearchaeota archaeon]
MEIEARVRVKDFEKLKQELINLGASFGDTKKQEDRYFYNKEQLAKEVKGPGSFVLRIRKSDKCFLTYKAFTDQLGAWDEHEVLIDDFDVMNTILLKSDFVQIIQVIKSRTKGNLGEYELCLDEIKDLGTFMEIQLIGEDKEDARQKLLALLNKLGFSKEDIEHRGYPEIMLADKMKFGGMK